MSGPREHTSFPALIHQTVCGVFELAYPFHRQWKVSCALTADIEFASAGGGRETPVLID